MTDIKSTAVHPRASLSRSSESASQGGDALAVTRLNQHKKTYAIAKRTLDIVFSLIATIVAGPALLVIAIAIRVDSRGNPFFRQERVGRHGEHFQIVKFRTMHHNADQGVHRDHHVELSQSNGHGSVLIRLANDERVTRVGGFLRRWSLDELPNLWNVFRGHMSLVGPRPLVPYEARMLDETARLRFQVRPGITGWAQVNGRLDVTVARRTDLDLAYVDNCSMWRDIVILAKTVPAVVLQRGH